MTRFWLVRHAETAEPGRFHGAESDIGLSPLGHEQAVRLAERFREWRPSWVVSSAMKRAVATALPVSVACGVPLRIEPRLHERRVGGLTGQPYSDPSGVWLQTVGHWRDGQTDFAPDGAESFDAMRDRLLPVWHRLAAEHAGRSVAVIVHGLVCKVLLLTLLPNYTVADWDQVGPVLNAAVSELVHDGQQWRATRINETVI